MFRKCDLAIVLDESGRTLDQTLARLVKAGVLERPAHGVYLFAHSRNTGPATIEHIARNLRRGELTYESLESAPVSLRRNLADPRKRGASSGRRSASAVIEDRKSVV